MQDVNESFDPPAPQPTKRKRSSILKQPDKRVSRDSRTVSFSDKFIHTYKDDTCFFLSEDMDITVMDVVDPTIYTCADMSLDQTITNDCANVSQGPDKTLCEDDMIDHQQQKDETKEQEVEEQEEEEGQEEEGQEEMGQEEEEQGEIEVEDEKEPSPNRTASMTRISEISSISNLTDFFVNDSIYGAAFHETANISLISNRTSGVDTLMHNVEALNDCIQRAEHHLEENQRRLDAEIDELFKFYRHIVNKQNKYEFAIAIFGLRHSLWLIIKINPETYPNERLHLRFAFNKKDRDLYPFREYAKAVEHCTKEGSPGYLTRFIINAQRFRRFLRKMGHRKINN